MLRNSALPAAVGAWKGRTFPADKREWGNVRATIGPRTRTFLPTDWSGQSAFPGRPAISPHDRMTRVGRSGTIGTLLALGNKAVERRKM